MARRKKPLYKTLTTVEKSLLEYPPTEKTWICKTCRHFLSGRNLSCVWCGAVKPKKPELAWSRYIKACNKIGIEPRSAVWRISPNTNQPMIRYNGSRWTEWNPPEEPVQSITRERKGKVRTRVVKQ